MPGKVLLVVPEAPAPGGTALVDERRIDKRGTRLGILDNSKGNADHLLRFIVDRMKSAVPVASVVTLRKTSVVFLCLRTYSIALRRRPTSSSAQWPIEARARRGVSATWRSSANAGS
jgi:hypothetical protein